MKQKLKEQKRQQREKKSDSTAIEVGSIIPSTLSTGISTPKSDISFSDATSTYNAVAALSIINTHANANGKCENVFESNMDIDPYSKIDAEMRACTIYSSYTSLCEEAIVIIRKWGHRYGQSRSDIWTRFTKSKDHHVTRVVKEFIEAAPIIQRVKDNLQHQTQQNGVLFCDNDKVTVIDLCSGFGFLSMFLSEMLPPHRVNRIILIDNRWSRAALVRDIEQGNKDNFKSTRTSTSAATGDDATAMGLDPSHAGADVLAHGGDSRAQYISADHITG